MSRKVFIDDHMRNAWSECNRFSDHEGGAWESWIQRKGSSAIEVLTRACLIPVIFSIWLSWTLRLAFRLLQIRHWSLHSGISIQGLESQLIGGTEFWKQSSFLPKDSFDGKLENFENLALMSSRFGSILTIFIIICSYFLLPFTMRLIGAQYRNVLDLKSSKF